MTGKKIQYLSKFLQAGKVFAFLEERINKKLNEQSDCKEDSMSADISKLCFGTPEINSAPQNKTCPSLTVRGLISSIVGNRAGY